MNSFERFIDLSRVLKPGVGEIPGHPATEFNEFQTHFIHDRSNARLSYSIHCGTHVDCPYHFGVDGQKVDEMSMERFIGRGVLVDLERKVLPKEEINLDKILENSIIANLSRAECLEAIILLHTGWGKSYESIRYYNENPYLSEEAARYFSSIKCKAVGLDFPPDGKLGSIVHRTLLGADVLIIENLTNLESLRGLEFEVFALPIKYYGQGGGPARVIARINGGVKE